MTKPYLGFGLGLRIAHYETILAEHPAIDWFEVITENYLVAGGKPLQYLFAIREHYPMVMHGVSLSIGSCQPLDYAYLHKVKQLITQLNPAWVSDHLCWTGYNSINTHDLLPLPYTEEALQHVVERVKIAQDFLGQQILLENVSSYLCYQSSKLTEWDFLREVANRADCRILLDINNIYVSSFNHGFDPVTYLENIPVEKVYQFHLAGHRNLGDYIIDTHDEPIIDPVWQLYRQACKRFGNVSTLIERDDHIPSLNELMIELDQARRWASQ